MVISHMFSPWPPWKVSKAAAFSMLINQPANILRIPTEQSANTGVVQWFSYSSAHVTRQFVKSLLGLSRSRWGLIIYISLKFPGVVVDAAGVGTTLCDSQV